MNRLLLFLVCAALTACGPEAELTDHPKPDIDNSEATLRAIYAQTQECAGLSGEAFETLKIEFRSEPWPCGWHPDTGCAGEFKTPSEFIILNSNFFDHEVIHYLLWVNKDNPDSAHSSHLFIQCSGVKFTAQGI